MATLQEEIAGLYAAFFDRAPDQNGLNFWVDQIQNQGKTLNDIAAGFAQHPVFASTYDGMTDEQYVNAIYNNMTGTDADAGGLQYYLDKLSSPDYSRADMVEEFVHGTLNADLTSPAFANLTPAELQAAQDRQHLMQNKVAVALDYVNTLGAATNVTATGDAIATDPAYLASQKILSGVTTDAATVTTAENLLNSIKTSPVAIETINQLNTITDDPAVIAAAEAAAANATIPAQVLTAGHDDLTGHQFFASETYFNVDGVGPTLNAGDRLTGTAGLTDNTLTVTDLTAGAANDNIPGGTTLNNIQIVKLNSSGNTAGGTGFSTAPYSSVTELYGTTNGGGSDVFTASNTNTKVTALHNGFTGNLTIVGGTDVNATTVGGNVVIGNSVIGTVPLSTQIATGDITVHQNNSGTGAVNVFGGKTVDITVSSHSNSGAIDVGNTLTNTGNSPAGGLANPTDNVTVQEAGTGNVTIFGGKDISVTDTALSGAGTITVGDSTYTVASNLPSGSVTITETADKAYDGLAGSAHNNTVSGAINVYGGTDVTIDTNASNAINIGNLTAAKEDNLNPTGAISITNTGVTTAGAAAAVTVTGGTTVDVTTTGAAVTIGRGANTGVIDSASNPTGNVTVTETMDGAGLGAKTISVDGGSDVTINAKGQTVAVGTSASSAPTGAVTVNQSDIFTGNSAVQNVTGAGNVTVDGGTDVTVNTTGGNVTVGAVIAGANVVPSGAISITNTFSGPGSDTVSTMGGTSVDVTTTQTSGAISVGNDTATGAQKLNAAGTALANADQAAQGDVTIVDKTTAGSTTAYGTGNVTVATNGATTVSVTGGDVDDIRDIQSILQTGGANAGQAVGTSTLASVTIDGSQSTDGIAIESDALTHLTFTNVKAADTVTITNNTSAHDLTITQGGTKVATTIVDAKAGTVTLNDNGSASRGVTTLAMTKATDLTVDNSASAKLNVGSISTDIATVTLKGAGNVSFASTDVFGTGNLAKALTINASQATGNITASIAAKTDTTAQTYTGGSGVDTITINSNASGWGANVKIDGGNGNSDIIVANYASAGSDVALGNDSHITGFETLKLGSAATGSYDASGFSTVQTGALAGNATITNAASGVELDVLADATAARTITVNGANTTATTNTMTVGLGSGSNNITAATGAITANGIETLTVNSTGGTAGNVATINDISTTGSAQLIVTGDQNLTLSSNAGFTSVNAADATGKVNVSTAAMSNSGVTFTGGNAQLTAVGSNAATAFKALVTMSDTDATDLAIGDTVTVNVNGTTFVYTATAAGSVNDVASTIATAINAHAATGTSTAGTNGAVVQTGAAIATLSAINSGGNIVLADTTAPFEVTTGSTVAGATTATTVNASLLGGQQQDVITYVDSGAANTDADTYTVDINGTTVTYTTPAADQTADDVATGMAAAINAAGIAGISSAVAQGAKVLITSQLGKTNVIDNLTYTDGGDGISDTTNAGTLVETINMTTVSNLVNSGAGGVDYTLGLGGSWDTVSHQFGSGSETVNLANSTAKVDTLRVSDGAVATFNGSTGGVSNFVVDSQNASDKLTFATAGKTILANKVVDNVSNVNGASTMANVLDSSGNLATKLSNLTYKIDNGVITFGATGGHSISEFTTGDLMSAAEILVSSSTTGGANKVAAFSSNGASYVVASDTLNTLAGGTDNKSAIVTLKDVADVKGFGSTFGEATIVSSNVTNLSNTAITALAASTTQDETGYAIATVNATGATPTVNTSVTNLNNLASSAAVNLTSATGGHMGTVNVTQVGTSGHNSLTANIGAVTTVDALHISGDAEVYFNAANAATSVISSLVDDTNTMNTVTVNGVGGVLTSITGTALTTIEAKNATGTFSFGDTTHIDAHNGLTVDVADNQNSTLYLGGANVTVTQNTATTTGTGAVSVVASGSGATIDLDNGTNTIVANGANDTISVGSGANTITATGADDTINVDSGAATTITVGSNATINLGNANAAGVAIADTAVDTILANNAVTGGDSSNYVATNINILAGTHNGLTDVVIDLGNLAGTTLGVNMAASQVNVAAATSLTEALDMAADYATLTATQGTAPAKLAANTAVADWFQYDGDTYIVNMQNTSASAVAQTALDADDVVIHLTGMVDLSTASFAVATDQVSF